MPRQYQIKLYMGDDPMSWAVFFKGKSEPIICGCSRKEAIYHKKLFERIDNEKEKDAT